MSNKHAPTCPAFRLAGGCTCGPLRTRPKSSWELRAEKAEARAYALRSEMCRLASWSRTPDEVAEALIAAVNADDALLDKIAEAEGK